MTSHKLKIGQLITELINSAKEIEGSDSPQKIKTQLFKRLATKFINEIYGDSRKSESGKVALTTARRYLTRARSAIQEFTGIHHRFNLEVERLIKKHPVHADMLKGMVDLSPSETRKTKKTILESLLDSREILMSVENLDFSKPAIKSKVITLAKKHPVYSDYILELNEADTQTAKKNIVKTLRDAQELYPKVSALKVDHELIVNLAMNKVDKDLMAKKSKGKLDIKKNTKVYVDYPRYMNQVVDILQRNHSALSGDVKDIAPLVFSLCAVTGRRPVEILSTGSLTAKTKNTLLFKGQAKKRDGDEDIENLIYSLVDSKVVESAFLSLRSSSILKSLLSGKAKKDDYRDDNSRLSGKISPHLSLFAKHFFIDELRVFKDTRGIYGRICYDRWYLTDPRWKNKDLSVFFTEIFGHADANSQSHYMPYQLSNFTADYVPDTSSVNKRWEMLCELDEYMPALARLDAAVELHNTVKDMVLSEPGIGLTQTMLATKTKKFRGTIKNYLMAIGDLALPGESLTQQFNDEPDDVSSDAPEKAYREITIKPKIKAKSVGDDSWDVSISLGNKAEIFNLKAGDKIAAMKAGYSLFMGE
tara:strand:+ start:167 stop:1936 length:1770 start_codon:yes stop_codon:yes gene_type:complete